MYPVYCQMFGAKHYPLKLKVENYYYFFDLKKKIKKVKPKLIALANPNQPIEVILNLKQISEICKMARRYNSLVIIDEAYYHFNNITAKQLINKFDNLIVVRTFSKAFGLAGMRVGYTMANKKIIGYMMSIKPIYEINAFNIKLIRLLINSINEMKNYTKAVKKGTLRLKRYLASYGIKMHGKYSNTVLFRLKTYSQVKKVTKFLYERKFIIRPMIIDGDNKFLRVTIGSEKIMGKFIKVLDKSLKNMLNKMDQWGKKNVVDFYVNNRNKFSDLYDSEKVPLRKIDKSKIKDILDFGCAVGGFYNIFLKIFNKKIVYHGFDTEINVIKEARKKFKLNKNTKFSKIDKKKKKISSKKYSLTFCTGVLNHNENYKSIKELIRCSSKYIFITLQSSFRKNFIGKLNLTKISFRIKRR